MRGRYTYRAKIAYDGAAFHGFARQVGRPTVEGALVEALRPMIPTLSAVAVGGRTDRGVHALGQVVSFWSREKLAPQEICESIDRQAVGALVALEVREAERTFHASFSATGRRYLYRAPRIEELDGSRVYALLAPLIGRRCFSAFARQIPANVRTTRQLRTLAVRRDDEGGLGIEISADGFLRRQVRVMVATALREALKGSADECLLNMARLGDRAATAPPAPPERLYLLAIEYDP